MKDVKRGLFYPIRIFFQFEFENAVFFSPRDHSEMLAKTMSESPTPSHVFSEFITRQIAMENHETKYKGRDN